MEIQEHLALNATNGTLSTPRIFAFIQARLSSTRLPKKILKQIPINGFTLLEHIYSRMIHTLPKEQIVFLIPFGESELVEYLKFNNWNFFQGNLEDVRDRYVAASNFYNADVILRLTGDNPFVDINAIEAILEAWYYAFFKDKKIDLVNYSPLPLGMGIESFSASALKNFNNCNEPHHKEHVSLHIKEHPELFKIVKLSSVLPEEVNQMRLTIDEPIDFSTLSEIYDIAVQSKKGNLFGGLEILQTQKEYPNVFLKNMNVQQIRFTLPDSDYHKTPIILILIGDPDSYGTGHWERMSVLSSALSTEGYKVILKTNMVSDFANINYIIVDAREDFLELPTTIPCLRIDSFPDRRLNDQSNAQFPNESYLDILPHASIPKWIESPSVLTSIYSVFMARDTPNNFLILNNNVNLSSKINETLEIFQQKKYILCYAGNLSKDFTYILDQFLVQNFPSYGICRIGGAPPKEGIIRFSSRISKREWWKQLNSCESFLSYFGQGLMEAILLNKKVASYSIGSYHSKLSIYLEKEWDIPFLGSVEQKLSYKNFQKSKISISNNAISKVLQWLKDHS
jgi:spore coat polysaccharide biosynthesis protein SpsF